MGKKKEEIEAEKKREIVRQLRKGPDLEQYVEGKKRKFTTYARGASLYSMNYYSFVNLAKEAGANIQIKKKVIVDLDILEKYIEEQCREGFMIWGHDPPQTHEKITGKTESFRAFCLL